MAGNRRADRAPSGQPADSRAGRFDDGQGSGYDRQSTSDGSERYTDTFDATSLISEEDLPAWLRQAIQTEEADAATRQREEAAETEAKEAAAEESRAAERELATRQAEAEIERRSAPAVPAEDVPAYQQAEPVLPSVAVETAVGADSEPEAHEGGDAVATPTPKRSRWRGQKTATESPRRAARKATPEPRRATPRSFPWDGHGDKVVLIVSLMLIIIAILLLAPALFG